MNLCPSLFKPTSTINGVLTRIRIPFGIISSEQIEAIASHTDSIHITNRANIQIRTSEPLSCSVLENFQDLGLAAKNPELDHLRNIMISPTAGIDEQALLDTRPLAIAWQEYLDTHPELAILSPKFSLGIDGGETVSIAHQHNDICLQAIKYNQQIYFSLHLINLPTGLLIHPEQTLDVLKALTEIYRNYTQKSLYKLNQKSPRLRELIQEWGMEVYLENSQKLVGYKFRKLDQDQLDESKESSQNNYQHLGIHNQQQAEYSYIGVVLPLGRLSSEQFRSLGNISQSLRLTPFQNLIIPNVPHSKIEFVKNYISELGLSISTQNPFSSMVACSGITGCKSSFTDTQTDGRAIAESIQKSIVLNHPINIHLTGCEKSCAQHHQSDLTLLGINADTYRIFVEDDNFESKFGRELYEEYPKSDLPNLISKLIDTYQSQRKSDEQSFREFVKCQTISNLKNSLDYEIRRGK